MSRVIVQVPMKPELKEKAERAAREQGFSSLQDSIRMFLHKLVKSELTFKMEYPEERLSPKADRRYNKIMRDIRSGKTRTVEFTNVKDMMKYLRS